MTWSGKKWRILLCWCIDKSILFLTALSLHIVRLAGTVTNRLIRYGDGIVSNSLTYATFRLHQLSVNLDP